MGSEHTDFSALDAAITAARNEDDIGGILSLVAANLSDSAGAPHLIRYTAEALTELKRFEDAVELYIDLARYAIAIDRPLDAMLAIDSLRTLNAGEVASLEEAIVERWSADYGNLEHGQTPVALPSDGAVMVEPIGASDAPLDVRVENALLACGAVLDANRELQRPSPIPLLSDLGAADLATLLPRLEREISEDGELLVSEGSPVSGFWWLARGGLTVQRAGGDARALNGPNILIGVESLFGEASLVTVSCLGRCDFVFLSRDALTDAINESASLRREVQQLVARYELHQAVSRCQLFRQLPIDKHAHLLTKFSAYRVPDGQLLIRQSAPSPGLFLITRGTVDLSLENGDGSRVITQLEPGDLLGLIGLQSGELARMSAVARDGTRVLFLERTDLAEALHEHPEAQLVLTRLREERAAIEAMAITE